MDENLSKINPFRTHFFNPKAKLIFTCLMKAFTEVLILHHFDPKPHIWIETDVSSLAISEILS